MASFAKIKLTRLVARSEKISNVEPDGLRKPLHAVDGNVALATFHRADVSTVKTCEVGQFLL